MAPKPHADYEKIGKTIFPLMSAWGRAIEAGEPETDHFLALQQTAYEDPTTMEEALTMAILYNHLKVQFTQSSDYDAETLAQRDPALRGLTRQQARQVFLNRMERVIALKHELGFTDASEAHYEAHMD